MDHADDKQDILLEAGTNELEVLVFSLGPTRYGVNVAKVREVIGQVDVVSVPQSHPAVIGVFKLREMITPLVDLQLFFEPGVASEAQHRNVIVMEFNDRRLGFLVDSVHRIYRMGWEQVRPMPLAQSGHRSAVTSVCEVDGQLVLMVDFEKIAFDISGDRNAFGVLADGAGGDSAKRSSWRVLLAEDSETIRGAIEANLAGSGYTRVVSTCDGEEAWTAIEATMTGADPEPFTFVVTDIEMPRMDGLCLCKRIKEEPRLRHIPVVVFSSLVSDSNLKKCEAVGADAAIAKPQMVRLVELLDDLQTRSDESGDHADREMLTAVQ